MKHFFHIKFLQEHEREKNYFKILTETTEKSASARLFTVLHKDSRKK